MNIKKLEYIDKISNDPGSFTKEKFAKQINNALQ